MKLTVLGSGSTIPHPTRTSSAYWLETSGGNILLDCSATAPARMAQENLPWHELDAIWISHFHMDHCGGLGPFFAGVKHAEQMKKREKQLNVYGPPGIRKLIDAFSNVHNYRLFEQPFAVEVVEVTALEPFEIVHGVEAVTMSTPHTDESHAIRFRDGEKTLVYSADTGFEDTIAALANRVDLFILECTYLKDKPLKKHLELAEAIYLIRKAHPARAMLTHFYPEWDAVNFDEEVTRFSPMCEVIEAKDGLTVEV
jgi:ribonuclease BN (tRNA processing enzyme)